MSRSSLKKRNLAFGIFLIIVAGVFGGVSAQPVRAHADYERSVPAADSVITEAPRQIEVWFTQELFRRKEANILEVFNSAGAQVDQKDTRIDDDDRTHVIVTLSEGLPAGLYTVRWRNLSAEDGHEGSGEFSFTLNPAAGAASPATVEPAPTEPAAPTLAPAPLVTPTSAAAAPSTPSTSGGLPCLGGMILAGLSLGLVVTGRSKGLT